MLLHIFCITATYLLGSLSSAILICKLCGLPDPRTQGSHNPGATNVLRIGGKLPAVATMLGDGSKGFIPTLLATYFALPSWVIGCVMLAALVGHIYPIFFKFKGGKGVATAMGALLGLAWPVGSILIAIWAVTILITRISSLGALVATLLIPLIGWWWLHDVVLTTCLSIMSLILLYRHKANIQRLFTGVEARV